MNRQVRKKNKLKVRSGLSAAVGAAVLVALPACASVDEQLEAAANDAYEIKVYFENNCPMYVDQWEIDMKRDKPGLPSSQKYKVEWVAWNLDGSSTLPNQGFEIYFDPFQGGHPLITTKGSVKSNPLLTDVPEGVNFKYTIVGTGCNGNALDPYVRIIR